VLELGSKKLREWFIQSKKFGRYLLEKFLLHRLNLPDSRGKSPKYPL
jgi:hypothetical protein